MFRHQISDILTDDALLLIFDRLDEADLQRCGVVCRKWHRLIYSDVVFKRFYKNKIKSSERWRKCFEMLKGAKILSGLRSAEICREISKQVKCLDENWQTGNFRMKIHSRARDKLSPSLRGEFIRMNDRFLLEYQGDFETLKILDKKTMKVKHKIFFHFLKNAPPLVGNTLMTPVRSAITFVDADTGQTLDKNFQPNGVLTMGTCFRSDGLIADVSEMQNPISRTLTIRRMNDAQDIALLKQLAIDDSGEISNTNQQMDENYIFVKLGFFTAVRSDDLVAHDAIYVVSTATLEMVRSLSVVESEVQYSQGHLIILNDRNLIGLVDVRSGTTRMVDLSPIMEWSFLLTVKTNSRYLVVKEPTCFENERMGPSKFYVFDIEAIKKSTCDAPLVASFEVPFAVGDFVVDETQVVCMGTFPGGSLKKMLVLDFTPRPPESRDQQGKEDPYLDGLSDISSLFKESNYAP